MNIEPLESRIAPAGVVAIQLTATDIKLKGDSEANFVASSYEMSKSDQIRIEASLGTILRFGDQTGTSFDIPIGTRKNLLIDLGAGDDELTLESITLDGKLDIKAGAGANTVNLDGDFEIGGAFSYLGGDGADSILGNVTSFRAASVLMDLKDGHNTVSISEANALWQLIESFRVIAGSGDDTVEFNGKSASLGGLDVNLGNGANSFKCGFDDIRDIGPLKLTSGTGADVFEITAANNLTIRKGITANLGGGSGDFQLAAGGNLSVRGATTVNFGDALDGQTGPNSARVGGRNINFGPLNFSAGQDTRIDSLIIAGYEAATGVTADNPAQNITLSSLKTVGANAVVLNATNTITVRDSANIYSNNMGSGLLGVVSLTAAGVDIGKDLLFTGGAGDAEFTLAGDNISIGGKLTLNLGDTATHETVNLGLPGGTLAAASVSVFSRTETVDNNETITIVAAGRIETTGSFSIVDGGGDANVQFVDGDLDIGKTFSVALGAGEAHLEMSGGSFRADSVSLSSAALAQDWETISLNYEDISWAGLKVEAGAGASNFSLDADRGRIGTAVINLGEGANVADIHSIAGLRIGKFGFVSKSANDVALETLSLDGVIAREVGALFGVADSVLAISRCGIGKLTTALGAGGDSVRINDSIFAGEVKIFTEAGNDSVLIERDAAHPAASTFFGKVTMALGTGDDTVLVAGVADDLKARFSTAVSVDAGDGTDSVLAHPTNATFAIDPLITNVP